MASTRASYPIDRRDLVPAQESYGRDRRTNLNSTFELACWHWALTVARRFDA